MKKLFFTMAVMALFAIGFAASDEEESSNASSIESSTPKAEQKQKTETESQVREQKAEHQASEKEEDNKKFAEFGYKLGYEKGFGANYHEYKNLDWEHVARIAFTKYVGVPSTPRDKEKYDIYLQNFKKGLEEGYQAQ